MDLSALSDNELEALEAQQQSGGDLSALTDSQLTSLNNLAQKQQQKDWNFLDAAKQLGSGAVENIIGLGGLANDLNPLGGIRYDDSGLPSFTVGPDLSFSSSKKASEELDPLLAARDPQYRYSRNIGAFVGPGALFKAAGMAPAGIGLIRALATDVAGGIGGQAGEDLTGSKTLGQLGGGLLGSGAASVGADALSYLRRLFMGATKEEIAGTASKILKETTGATPGQLDAVNSIPDATPLDALKTTAEKTGNAGFAQLEKTLADTGERAKKYAALDAQRQSAREGMIADMSPVKAVNPEGLGSELINAATKTEEGLGTRANELWDQFPRHEPVDVGAAQKNVVQILKQKQGGLDAGSKTLELMQQFLDPEAGGIMSSGKLQDIRSSILDLSREAKLSSYEQRVLGAMQKGIDSAMERSLTGEDLAVWKAARDTTKYQKETFGRGTAGGAFTGDTARPSTVLGTAFKGDAQSVDEIGKAIGGDAGLFDKVKRGILDKIPRDAKDQITPNGMKKFIAANESGLKELLGEDHFGNLVAIKNDLQSQAKVGDMAYLSSKGNSVTQQRQTVAGALEDLVTQTLTPGTGKLAGVIEAFKRSSGIKDAEAVRDLLFKAALDSKAARDLAATPTTNRILSAIEQLKRSFGVRLPQTAALTALKAPPVAQNIKGLTVGKAKKEERLQPANKQEAPQKSPPTKSAGLLGSLSDLSIVSTAQAEELPARPGQAKRVNSAQAVTSPASLEKGVSKVQDSTETGGKFSLAKLEAGIKSLHPFIQAVIKVESNGNPLAKSKAGAVGLMQLMPETAKAHGVEDRTDPVQNIKAGIAEYESLIHRFGDLRLAMAAYNWGQGRLAKLIDRLGTDRFESIYPHLPEETKSYIAKIQREVKRMDTVEV